MNPTFLAIWRWVASFSCYLNIVFHLYQLRSALHRFFWDRAYADTPITTYASVKELREWVAQQNWVADNWTELWDAVCTPQKVQAVGQGKVKVEGDHAHDIGDCDEFAIYISNAIEKALAAGQMKEMNIANPRFFTVCWMTRDGKTDGHNVCLLERPQPDGTVKFSYMDYAMPSEPPLDTPAQIAVQIACRYSGDGDQQGKVESGVLAWGISKPDMSPVTSSFGSGWNKGERAGQ